MTTKTLKSCVRELGFDYFSVALPHIPAGDKEALRSWIAAGRAAGLSYLSKDPEERARLQSIFPMVKSVITVGVSYFQGVLPKKPGPAFGRVARTAWGEDYHSVISDRLEKLMASIRDLLGGDVKFVLAVDTKPIMEKALARLAGAGFIGKNTVLIVPRSKASFNYHVGSWVFLGEILLDIELPSESVAEHILPAQAVIPAKAGIQSGVHVLDTGFRRYDVFQRGPINEASIEKPHDCGACSTCMDACPTGALPEPYVLDARRCIAYLTIENKGWIPKDLREKIGDRLFGCDLCQDVCPFNAQAKESQWPEFRAERGAGPWVSIQDILSIESDAALQNKWGQTPLARAKRRGLLRNACVVAGNSKDESLVPFLHPLLQDSDSVIRGHALWALSKLLSRSRSRSLAESLVKKETDPIVKAECEEILNGVV
ncbi:MAG: DUF1730 domain-containing protein [Elusimicrobia bacterium]|nr:DUF1730 domain-containing protein [Candidatus Obscuribacterium magneticum]